MTLKQLARIIPGYVALNVHGDESGWSVSAGVAASTEKYDHMIVVCAVPLAPYVMEITIKEE